MADQARQYILPSLCTPLTAREELELVLHLVEAAGTKTYERLCLVLRPSEGEALLLLQGDCGLASGDAMLDLD